jgi:hypothetical protein
MGLMEDLGAWLDQKKRNVASSVQNPGLLYTRMNEDARQFQQDQRANWGDVKSVVPEVKAAGLDEFSRSGQELGAMAPAGLLGWTAWHGSPHKFDKFDLSKIGTGEGAQAYGHGLYFADTPQVAIDYQKNLGGSEFISGDKVLGKTGQLRTPEGWAASLLHNSGGDPKQAIAQMEKFQKQGLNGYTSKSWTDKIRAAIDDLSKTGVTKRDAGILYKVDISDAKAPQDAFLQWDKPLSEQPDHVQGILRKQGYSGKKWNVRLLGENLNDSYVFDNARDARNFATSWRSPDTDVRVFNVTGSEMPITGEKLYRDIAAHNSGPTDAAAILKQLGIPGIRYLDGGSRGAGSGTMNTVLFDDSLVKILERNGQPLGLLGP